MKKVNTITQYHVEDDYFVDVVKKSDGWEAWIYDDCTGIKMFIASEDLETTEEEFLDMIEENFADYQEAYDNFAENMDTVIDYFDRED